MPRLFSTIKLVKVVSVILTIVCISYLIGYIFSANSDAFFEARRFIIQSSVVNSELGSDINVQLAPFGYEIEFSGSWGVATFDCSVRGSRVKGNVQITLNKIGNTWRVKAATLHANGKDTRL